MTETAGFTDIGPVRKENQDVWSAMQLSGGSWALLLADGMGGHTGGREAAEAATSAASRALKEGERAPEAHIRDAVSAANQAVAEVARQLGHGPGTTLVVAIVRDGEATVGNVGDSRAYHVAGGAAAPITEDHSWVGDEVRAGRLTEQEIRRHTRRNIITRAVMGEDVSPDVFTVQLSPGDVLMLCSDGVWEPLDDARVAELLSGDDPLDVLVERLCRAALAAGGTDNATAVALRQSPAR